MMISVTLNSPLSEEDLDKIYDVDMDNTSKVTFHTKHGKEVEFVKVRHGRWIIPRFGADAKCSVCGMYYSDVYDMESKDHYCRNCGAKMDGEQND